MNVQAGAGAAGHAGPVEPDEHISALEREGTRLAAAAGRRGLGAPLPACPGWQMRELLRHLGYVHRWAATYVGQARQEMIEEPPESEILRGGPADPELLNWFRAGLGDLVGTLRSADPGLICWTFFAAPTPLAFWARRQAHETAIHRADAEGAPGDAEPPPAPSPVTPFPAAFAADGIDELLTGFAPRARFKAQAGQDGSPPRLLVRAADTGDEWLTEIGERMTARRSADQAGADPAGPDQAGADRPSVAPAQCVVAGPASDLYLALWNRQPVASPVTVTGDATVLALWQARIRVTW
jgi:uncharacterized protein (TIGR03083 family)